MKVEKFKVLLYLKKSEPDKSGKSPIMGRITLNRTIDVYKRQAMATINRSSVCQLSSLVSGLG